MESINRYLSYEQQIKNLESKNLEFPDQESKEIFIEYLKEYNYSHFILGLKNKLMFDKNNKYKKGFTSNNIRYLFDIDRNISATLWKYFKGLELHFNSSVVKVLAEIIQKKTDTPYLCCLSEEDFLEIFSNLNNVKYFSTKNYLIDKKRSFIEEFYKNYDNVYFFDDVADSNLDKEHDEIIGKIDKSWIAHKFNTTDVKKRKWVYIQLFTLCSALTFSQLQKIFKALNISLKNKIIDEFLKNLRTHKKMKMTEFDIYELMDLFNKLRNALAHNGCMIKYRYKIKNTSKLFNFFDITKNEDEKDTTLLIIDFINIIENIRGLADKEIIKNEILNGISYKLQNRNKRDYISPILYQILEDETHLLIPDEIKNIQ